MPQFDLPWEELQSYRPQVTEPADFDAFWQRTLAQARAAGGEVTVTDAGAGLPHVDVHDVTFPGFDGEPIKAWYSRPAGVTADLPLVVQFHGYGGGRMLPVEHTLWPAAGFAHLMVDNRGQGSSWGSGGDTPDAGHSGPALPGFMTRGIDSPDTYFYRRLMTDAVRAVDAGRTLAGVDPARVAVAGVSQGGGVALAVAALVPDLWAVMPDVPFLSHIARAVRLTDADPYGEIRRYLAVHRDATERVFATLAYVDGVNFARRITAPSLWSVALCDEVCPPSTVMAAFNHCGEHVGGTAKEMVVYPFNGHEGGAMHQVMRQLEFVRAL